MICLVGLLLRKIVSQTRPLQIAGCEFPRLGELAAPLCEQFNDPGQTIRDIRDALRRRRESTPINCCTVQALLNCIVSQGKYLRMLFDVDQIIVGFSKAQSLSTRRKRPDVSIERKRGAVSLRSVHRCRPNPVRRSRCAPEMILSPFLLTFQVSQALSAVRLAFQARVMITPALTPLPANRDERHQTRLRQRVRLRL